MKMDDFWIKAGDLLLYGGSSEGVSPRRIHRALFWYERGEASYGPPPNAGSGDPDVWTFKIYTEKEQARVDRERAACA